MKYMGSKQRIAKYILPIMLDEARKNNIKTWVEPFLGGANVIDKVPDDEFKRFGVDINPHTIQSLIAIRDYVDKLPDEVSEEYYKSLKGKEPDPITSWIRFVASFGGKFENGYAREKGSDSTTFIGYGKRNAQKQSPFLQNVDLRQGSYEQFYTLSGCLIYCDIPYKGTTSYKTEKFNHDEFWGWCRHVSKNNIVFISEYEAPDDFEVVWEGDIKTNFASQRNEHTHKATEKLFKYKFK